MADPTAEEVHAALAVLAAAEAAREVRVEPPAVVVSPAPAVAAPATTVAAATVIVAPTSIAAPTPVIVAPAPAAPAAPVDPYLARSVKSSPNGF